MNNRVDAELVSRPGRLVSGAEESREYQAACRAGASRAEIDDTLDRGIALDDYTSCRASGASHAETLEIATIAHARVGVGSSGGGPATRLLAGYATLRVGWGLPHRELRDAAVAGFRMGEYLELRLGRRVGTEAELTSLRRAGMSGTVSVWQRAVQASRTAVERGVGPARAAEVVGGSGRTGSGR